MERLLLICLAGGLGTGARYLTTVWAAGRFGDRFPVGTVLVNLIGCFALALVVDVSAARAWSPELRAALAVGFLGGFTTYSSFNLETMRLLQGGSTPLALANVVLTLVGGLVAGAGGLYCARLLTGR
jgi:CrcB protein